MSGKKSDFTSYNIILIFKGNSYESFCVFSRAVACICLLFWENQKFSSLTPANGKVSSLCTTILKNCAGDASISTDIQIQDKTKQEKLLFLFLETIFFPVLQLWQKQSCQKQGNHKHCRIFSTVGTGVLKLLVWGVWPDDLPSGEWLILSERPHLNIRVLPPENSNPFFDF